jgi:DNA recombination protein RmuC
MNREIAMAPLSLQLPIEVLLLAGLLLILICLVLVIVGLRRQPRRIDALLREHNGRLEALVKDEMSRNRQEASAVARQAREELVAAFRLAGDSIVKRMIQIARLQKDQLDSLSKQLLGLTRLNEQKFDSIRNTLDQQLGALQQGIRQQLEQIRVTVDEKLHSTLEKRLGESFSQVSERLEQVYKGLGEMRHLAAGVGDLKRLLTNVKARGIWGEIRLSHILEQILTPDQYGINVSTKPGSSDRVEFAVKLPGSDPDENRMVWLPIDSKFPQEDYQRFLDAQEAADKAAADQSLRSLENRIKLEAKNIRAKYIDPPHTTDFAIMFLPVEGLYAEVLRRPGLCDLLQRDYRVAVAGPTTLAALLNSLQMGFRTLAIERRSSEVWELLGTIKTEFGKFGDILTKTKHKLREASQSIDQAAVRSRAIERKLRRVQEVPLTNAESGMPNAEKENEDGEGESSNSESGMRNSE